MMYKGIITLTYLITCTPKHMAVETFYKGYSLAAITESAAAEHELTASFNGTFGTKFHIIKLSGLSRL